MGALRGHRAVQRSGKTRSPSVSIVRLVERDTGVAFYWMVIWALGRGNQAV